MHVPSAVEAMPPEQSYGPPATTPAPLTTDDHAVANCTAMKAPDEMPEIVVSWIGAFNAGSGGSAARATGPQPQNPTVAANKRRRNIA
jgi:hypothetical protein